MNIAGAIKQAARPPRRAGPVWRKLAVVLWSRSRSGPPRRD